METPAEMVRAAEHTPGPWKVDPETGFVCTDVQNIAEIIPDTVSDAEIAANRALISAAPDLLAACEKLDSLDCCDGYTIPDTDYPKLWDALNLARAALGRAKGGKS